jgi:hypothetical protein
MLAMGQKFSPGKATTRIENKGPKKFCLTCFIFEATEQRSDGSAATSRAEVMRGQPFWGAA